jgi:endonuclease/exonuclease/phosphatase family metal-dependent hydrolase
MSRVAQDPDRVVLVARTRRATFRRLSHRFASTWLLLPALLTNGCAQALNYGEPDGPRFAGSYVPVDDPRSFDGTLDVVTLNIQFSLRIARAQQLFDRVKELGRADVVLLQEMDAAGTEALAAHLGMTYVYYPATVHPMTSRDFGNAILSRWPISRDRKIQLPHHGFSDGSQRTATCATVETPIEPVEVCSLHLATPVELSPRARREQALAVVSGLGHAQRVVVGGDFNSHRVGNVLTGEAFDWPTKDIGKTRGFFSLDHLFTRGLAAESVGKVSDTRGATDHAAVWAKLTWR